MRDNNLWNSAGKRFKNLPRSSYDDLDKLYKTALQTVRNNSGWTDRLCSYLISTSLTEDERRYWVRFGISNGCGGLLEDFERDIAQHMADLEKSDLIEPSDCMERFCSAPLLPQSMRDFISEKEQEQILARLEDDGKKPTKELVAAWNGYQSKPRIIGSKYPKIQAAVHSFGERAAKEYWSFLTDYFNKISNEPFNIEQFKLIRDCCDIESKGKVICRPKFKSSENISVDVPAYPLFQEAWFGFRKQFSRYYWSTELERIRKAAEMPFGSQKMGVAQDEARAAFLDTEPDEYRLYKDAWDAFSVKRTEEYWQSERDKLNSLRQQLNDDSNAGYIRDAKYDALLVRGLGIENKWKAELAEYNKEVFDAQCGREKKKLLAKAEKWRETAEIINSDTQNIRVTVDKIEFEKQSVDEVDALIRKLDMLLREYKELGDPEKWFDDTKYYAHRSDERTIEQTAFLDIEKEMSEAIQQLIDAKCARSTLLDAVKAEKRQYEARRLQEKIKQQRLCTFKRTVKTVSIVAAVFICLAALKFISGKTVRLIAGIKAENGQLVEAYTILDKTAFLGCEIEELRIKTLGKLREELLEHGYRDTLLEKMLTSNSEKLVKDSVLNGRTDIELILSDSVVVYREKNSSSYMMLFENNPMELRIPKGLELKTVWGYGTNPFEINALCTDGTVLRGSVGWTFATKYAEPSYYER